MKLEIVEYARLKAVRAFSFATRIKSFRFALEGLWFFLRTQPNAWLHLAATCLVCSSAYFLHVSVHDWSSLIIAIIVVWISETLNTAFEHLCDVVSPAYSESVKRAKDVAAGAVLLSAIGATVIGAVIFGKYL